MTRAGASPVPTIYIQMASQARSYIVGAGLAPALGWITPTAIPLPEPLRLLPPLLSQVHRP